MSNSDAVLFFGYCWDHFVHIDFDLDNAIIRLMAERRIHDPWDDRPSNMTFHQFEQENLEEIKLWNAARGRIAHEIGVDIGWYGDETDMRSFVHVTGTDTTAYEGNAELIPLTALNNNHAANYRWWQNRLDVFLASHDVKPPEGENQPGWWLVARECL